MCNKCEDAGKRGGRHSALIPALPLVKCNRYHQLDHISKNYTNPRGCPFRVHLVSTFSFRAFAARSCYGIISFRISIYFPFGRSSFPRLRPGGVSLSAPFPPPPPPPLFPLPFVFSCTSRFNSPFHGSSWSMHVGCAKHNVDLRWLEFGPTCHLPSNFKMIRWENT